MKRNGRFLGMQELLGTPDSEQELRKPRQKNQELEQDGAVTSKFKGN